MRNHVSVSPEPSRQPVAVEDGATGFDRRENARKSDGIAF